MGAGPIGEIVETATTAFVAQACELGQAPPFGGFVRVDQGAISTYGVVSLVRTGGLEPGARAVLRGREGVRDEAIFHENPDLRSVLRTEFSALIVGFREGERLHQYLPAHPPPLHWSVYCCEPEEVAELTAQLDYFRTLLGAADVPADELLAANLRLARAARPFESSFSLRAGRELARLLPREYDRLSAILRRVGA